MELYHSTPIKSPQLKLVAAVALIWLVSCAAPQVTQGDVSVIVNVDGDARSLSVPAGSTVQDALQAADIERDPLDRTEPPLFTVLTEGQEINVIRVEEEFVVEEIVVAFEEQILRNESLPEGETRLVQPGVNGLQEITYRRLIEEGVEISNSPVKSVMVREPIPEIMMVGSQSAFAAIPIPGRIVYLSAGNAWTMEDSTGNRRPIITTGDLDGRVFALSPQADWLMFTRRSEDEGTINSLWAAKIDDESNTLIDLKVDNVVHFAGWSPAALLTVAFSTVEPRATAPGWQANNDLVLITFSSSGWVSRERVALESNSGGIYGWWGTDFAWSPDGSRLAFARPDAVGLVNLDEEQPIGLLDITPLQTNSDWAWVPGMSWGPDGNTLFTVDHAAPQGVIPAEESPLFDLTAIPLAGGAPLSMVSEVGMFAYPVPSPWIDMASEGQDYLVAFLQSIFPTQSETSRYRLIVMDRDGSNRRVLFPPEGAPGLEPQRVYWSPGPLQTGAGPTQASHSLAVLYQQNLWLIDVGSGEARQVTGDGLIDRLDWK